MNSLISTTNAIAITIGYSLAGILMVSAGFEILFLFDGISFIISGVAVLAIAISKLETKKIAGYKDFVYDIKEGLVYIKENKDYSNIISRIFYHNNSGNSGCKFYSTINNVTFTYEQE